LEGWTLIVMPGTGPISGTTAIPLLAVANGQMRALLAR